MANPTQRSASRRRGDGPAHSVTNAVGDLVAGVGGAMAPLTKTARRELKRLERKLASARKNEAKRRRQATDAAADVAAIVARISGLATA